MRTRKRETRRAGINLRSSDYFDFCSERFVTKPVASKQPQLNAALRISTPARVMGPTPRSTENIFAKAGNLAKSNS